MGHVVPKEGVAEDPKKIEVMQQWPIPRDLRDLRGFLGFTGYYQRFVKDYGKITVTFTNLLKKNTFHWDSKAQEAFDTLKIAMITILILAMPDFSKEFEVETDASSVGLGAVLIQNSRPMSFLSKALSLRNRSKSVYEKELMAIVFAFYKWHYYCLGCHCKFRTEQKSLKFLMEQRVVGFEQQKWLVKLMGYDFMIVYHPECKNKVVDALSHNPQFMGEYSISTEKGRR